MNNMHDDIICRIFWDSVKKRTSSLYRKFNQRTSKYPNIVDYLHTRYNDSSSNIETLHRIVYNIEERPVCDVCGKPVIYIGKPNNKGVYTKYCSNKCANIANKEAANKTKIDRYGSVNNTEKSRQTKLERYGDANYNGDREAAISKVDYSQIVQKTKQTKLEKYGDANYNGDREVAVSKVDYKQVIEKSKHTRLDKYGDANYNGDRKAATSKIDYIHVVEQVKQTKLEKYGDANYNNQEKAKQTLLEHHKVDSPFKLNNFSIQERTNKAISTKRANHTFKTSRTEDETYKILSSKWSDVIRQYKSDVYPFACDFYIPSLDLYIECQYGWTHGDHAFTDDDIPKYEWMMQRSNYYKNAAHTWRYRDTLKRHTAKENNLNWIEFFNIDEFKKWFETYE